MEEKGVGEVTVDTENKIVTTPAYMFNGKFHEIQDGVTAMITELFSGLGHMGAALRFGEC